MPFINPLKVYKLLGEKLQMYLNVIDEGMEDSEFANTLFKLIQNKFEHPCDITEEIVLDFSDDIETSEIDSSEESSSEQLVDDNKPSSSDFNPDSSPDKRHKPGPKAKDNINERIYNFVINEGKGRKGRIAAAERKFKKSRYFIENALKNVGSRASQKQQFRAVKDFMFMSFQNARRNGNVIHYWNLKFWAITAAKRIGLDFRCSKHFLNNFKREKNIVTRKITKYLTKTDIQNDETTQNEAMVFVHDINDLIKHHDYNRENVWNSDQSRFEYEIVSARTLSHAGEKDTWASCQSSNSLTHSYTIQIHISLAGKLGNKLYICFQEKGGSFGSKVETMIRQFTPNNMYVDSSASGKMTKYHVKKWYKNVFKLDVPTDDNIQTLLLLDSWSGQTDTAIVHEIFPGKKISVSVIPPKATKYIQPLDRYFFLQYKLIIRRIEEEMRYKNVEEGPVTKLNDRKFIMRMHSCVYNQFCAPQFNKMVLYAWKTSGYDIGTDLPSFQSVLDTTFNIGMDDCFAEACEQIAFLRCAHCFVSLCIDHFLDEDMPHYHDI